MKLNIVMCMLGLIMLAAWTRCLAAQGQADQSKSLPHYSISILQTLGGTVGQAYGINNKGWVTGDANLPGDDSFHATLLRDGAITALGTLGGPDAAAGFTFKNDRGLIAAFGQTVISDPLNEDWSFFCTLGDTGNPCSTNLITGGFLWVYGFKMRMPTLGGNNGEAAAVNNLGQVVGWAENAKVDSNCVAPQVLDFEAVIWTPSKNEIRELPPFPGDSISAAISINDQGQVVGASGSCAAISPAIGAHALVWQNGSPTNLGSLGGAFTNVAYDINNRGQVAGVSDLPGDATGHAFLWENGEMTDPGTLPGDFFSAAFAINDNGQVVGQSCDQNGNCRAFLWQNGVMFDLNSLVPHLSSFYLYMANDINDLGAIVGEAFDPTTGSAPAFLATPTFEVGNTDAKAAQIGEAAPNVIFPKNVRKSPLQQRSFRRFVAPPIPHP